MKRYEYLCRFIWGGSKRTTRILNEYGSQGWELIFVIFGWHYFKKPL